MQKSLSLKINIMIIAVVSIVTLCLGGYDYTQSNKERAKHLQKELSVISTRLQRSLTPPLWDLNTEDVNSLIRAEMMNQNVLGVEVKERFSNKIITNLYRNTSWEIVNWKVAQPVLNSFASTEMEVIKDGIVLGSFKLHMTDHFVRAESLSQFRAFLFRIVMLLLVEVVFLVTIIQRHVVRPISSLEAAFSDTEDKSSRGKLDTKRNDEIGQLARSFISMQDHLTSLFAERNNRISELESTKKELLLRETSLKQYTQRLAIHVEQTPLAVIEWDINFKVVQWNRAAEKIFGYTSDEALGNYGPDLIVPTAVKKDIDLVWKALLAKKGGERSTNENITKNGKILTCEWYNTTLIDSDGVIIGVASLILDITEAINLEDKLRQSHKMEAIGTLAGGIAHDFNNILSIIIGYTEMARDDSPPGSSVVRSLDEVLTAGLRAKDLVKQILTFSRQADAECIPLQPAKVVKEVIQLIRPTLPSTIEILQDIDTQTGAILADPTQIHQILMNLCTNAFHAMEETGGTLNITLKETYLSNEDLVHEPDITAGSFVQLSIGNSGPGIPPEIKDKIFDPYFTTKEQGKGTGMGLSIAHGIVKSGGGFISLYSEYETGTVFHVFLPVMETGVLSEIETLDQVPTGNERILFVDDEDVITAMGKDILERLGYHVTVRNSSLEALSTFQNNPDQFDIVITDQTMPGMTGADLAKRMMLIRPDIPIILCTGYSNIINDKQAKSMGVRAYALKPLAKKDIATLIRKVLDAPG